VIRMSETCGQGDSPDRHREHPILHRSLDFAGQ
jgi:hypothetical protein